MPEDANPEAPSPTRCPLCGSGNACAVQAARAQGQDSALCWCMTVQIPASLRACVPVEARGRSCICPACVAASHQAAAA